MDVWSELGGEIYFSQAEEISNSGQNSTYSNGWDGRQQYIEDVLYFKEFRKSKYLFFQSLDQIYMDDGIYENQLKALNIFYNASLEIPDYMVESKYVRNFYKAYSEEIAKNFFNFKMIEELREFQYLDPENKTIYKKYISD